MAAAEFTGYAINWYDQVVSHRRRTCERPIETWDEVTMMMRRWFVPSKFIASFAIHNDKFVV